MSSRVSSRPPLASRAPKAPKLDAVCAEAVDVAREAAVEVGGETVGDHVVAYAEGERVVTHQFHATVPGYVGWHWSVTVARVPRSKVVTTSEIALLPGQGALLAPEWLPWSERLRPGDLRVGDLLPTAPDDERLEPGYLLSDDPAVAEVEVTIGLGRVRVMSRLGREETAGRWYASEAGPDADLARVAPARCQTCGFYLPLAGSLGQMFGACGNVFAPDDGRVVSSDHGCGAHSEALVEQVPVISSAPMAFDDSEVEMVAAEAESASVSDSIESEPLGHG